MGRRRVVVAVVVVNHVNANALGGVPFLLLVKMVSSARFKYCRIGLSWSRGMACPPDGRHLGYPDTHVRRGPK